MDPLDDDRAAAERAAEIDEHRRYIDRIDKTIVALLTERMRLGRTLGHLKLELRRPARSPAREAEVLERVRQAAAGPLSPASAERIFAAIIAETAAAQDDSRE